MECEQGLRYRDSAMETITKEENVLKEELKTCQTTMNPNGAKGDCQWIKFQVRIFETSKTLTKGISIEIVATHRENIWLALFLISLPVL